MDRVRYLWAIYTKAFGLYTGRIVIIILLALVSSIAEGLGISAIIPIFSFVGGASGAASDTISRIIESFFTFLHIGYSFRMLLIFVGTLFVTRILLIFFIQYTTAQIVYSYERDLRARLFDETMHARWPYLAQQQIGNLEQLLTTNTTNASQFFGTIATSAMIVTKVLMYIVVAINASWWVAGLALAAGATTFFAMRQLFYRTKEVAQNAERTNRALAHFVGEHVIGIKAIKAMALEAPVIARGRVFFESMREFGTRSVVLRGQVQMLVQLAGVAFVALIFAIMYRSPGFSLASFAVIVYAINQIFAQIQAGQAQLHGITTLLPYVAEALSYNDRTRDNREADGGGDDFALADIIEFNDVSFAYPTRSSVLSRVNFNIRKGEMVGIVGPSGAGKTTLADLFLRLIEPSEGSITIDGRDVRDIAVVKWRTHVGYVAQDAVLLNDTIAENIRFYNQDLSRDGIISAAKLANIHTYIETLPHGYETIVGDRGVMLSGGQRQRIALARVLARKPQLLVLDEATSALDAESERAIKSAVEGLRGTTTVIVIAHRLSTIQHADRFLVVQDGAVKEADRHHVLQEV